MTKQEEYTKTVFNLIEGAFHEFTDNPDPTKILDLKIYLKEELNRGNLYELIKFVSNITTLTMKKYIEKHKPDVSFNLIPTFIVLSELKNYVVEQEKILNKL